MGTTHFSYAKQNPLLYKTTSSQGRSSIRQSSIGYNRNRPQLGNQTPLSNFSRSSKSRFSVFNHKATQPDTVSVTSSVRTARDMYGKRIRKRFNEEADCQSVKSMNSERSKQQSILSANLLTKSAVNMTPSLNQSSKAVSTLTGIKSIRQSHNGSMSDRYSRHNLKSERERSVKNNDETVT